MPSYFSPQGLDFWAILLVVFRFIGGDATRLDFSADQNSNVDIFGGFFNVQSLEDRLHTGKIFDRQSIAQMVEGQHGVGFSATEVSLQFNHRLSAITTQTQQGIGEELLESFGEVGAAEKFRRVAVFVRAFIEIDLPEVGGKFGLLEASRSHIGVGGGDFPPGFQSRHRLSLRRCDRLAPCLSPGLFFKAKSEDFLLLLLHLLGVGGNRTQ